MITSLLIAFTFAAGPLSPQEAMKTLQPPAGFVIELVAAEPMVLDPVAVAWDERGRMFVAEMGDYPVGKTGGMIRLLEDRDGDGAMDSSVIFADHLPFPTSVLPWNGGVLVSAAPDVLFLKDQDGDGKAEIREIVLTGFGEGNQQLRVNGLHIGLDGWVYGANGRSGGVVRSPKRPKQAPVDIANHDFRFRPATGEFEKTTGFAQFGLAFNDVGDRFINWNTVPMRQVVLPLANLQSQPTLPVGGAMEILEDPADASRIYPRATPQPRMNREPIGYFNASCGLTIERGGSFPVPYAGCAFVCEPLFNLVHRRELTPRGPTYTAKRGAAEKTREFLASTDPWFRPVNLATGPDGGLYVVDFYREWVEHPQFVRDDLEKGIEFSHGNDRGRIYRIRPKDAARLKTPNLADLSTKDLVTELQHSNGWRRDTAQRLLIERRDVSAKPLLESLIREDHSGLAGVHALWTLQALDSIGGELLESASKSKVAIVREHAVRIAADRSPKDPSLAKLVRDRAHDEDSRVRFQTALALGVDASPEAAAALAAIAGKDADDPWIRTAVLTSIRLPMEFLTAWRPQIAMDKQQPSSGSIELARQCFQLIGATPGPIPPAALEWIGEKKTWKSPSISIAALAGLGEGLERTRRRFIDEVGEAKAENWFKAAREIVLHTYRGTFSDFIDPGTLDAVRFLKVDPSGRTREVLFGAIEGGCTGEIKREAVRALSRRDDVGGRLLSRWTTATPSLRQELLDAVFQKPKRLEFLFSAIKDGTIQPAEIDLERRKQLIESKDPAFAQAAKKLFAGPASSDRTAVIQAVTAKLPPQGSAANGKEIFKKNCSACHRIMGEGNRVGPELAGLAAKSPSQLLEDVLDPNRQVLPDFIAFSIATQDGQVKSGLMGGETGTGVLLKRAEGIEEVVSRDQIAEIRSTGKSLMPEGFEQTLKPADLADLIEYLRRPQ